MFSLNNPRISSFTEITSWKLEQWSSMNLTFPFLRFLFHHGTYNLQTPIQERNNLKAERTKLVTKTSIFVFYETFQSNKCVTGFQLNYKYDFCAA